MPFARVVADELDGRGRKLREACEQEKKGYVIAVKVNFQVRLPSGRKATAAAVAAMVPAAVWETRSCGCGCKGHRDYEWTLGRDGLPYLSAGIMMPKDAGPAVPEFARRVAPTRSRSCGSPRR